VASNATRAFSENTSRLLISYATGKAQYRAEFALNLPEGAAQQPEEDIRSNQE
jgi:hypothetical protein